MSLKPNFVLDHRSVVWALLVGGLLAITPAKAETESDDAPKTEQTEQVDPAEKVGGLPDQMTPDQMQAEKPIPQITLESDAAAESAVTVFSGGLALVRDVSEVKLAEGSTRLRFGGVTSQLRPETALLGTVDRGPEIRVLEQVFDFDLLTPQALMEASVGGEVLVIDRHPETGEETTRTGRLLAIQGGPVVLVDGRIETALPGRIAFTGVPEGLAAEPRLSMAIENPAAGTRTLSLSYLTGGLSWKADYVAELGDDDRTLNLAGWATLANQSGRDFTDTTVKLVAGDVNRVSGGRPEPKMMRAMAAMADAEAAPSREKIAGYHLYALPRPVTLNDKQTKQIGLMTAPKVQITKELLVDGSSGYHGRVFDPPESNAQVVLVVENAENHGLGKPLPGGIVRVYKKDSSGQPQFIGEDRIEHTPVDGTLRLALGRDFDVPVKREQTAFARPDRQITESSHRVTVGNAGPKDIQVWVIERIPGDWTITSESQEHKRLSGGRAEWSLMVPAGGSATLDFSVRTRF